MPFLKRVFLYGLMILMTACAGQKAAVLQARAISLCKAQCLNTYKACIYVCHDNGSQCSAMSCQKTAYRYTKYWHEQFVQGKIIARELNSYRDPLQCRKVTCDCNADYRICLQGCEGISHLQYKPDCPIE